jgi:hypothetical protein
VVGSAAGPRLYEKAANPRTGRLRHLVLGVG